MERKSQVFCYLFNSAAAVLLLMYRGLCSSRRWFLLFLKSFWPINSLNNRSSTYLHFNTNTYKCNTVVVHHQKHYEHNLLVVVIVNNKFEWFYLIASNNYYRSFDILPNQKYSFLFNNQKFTKIDFFFTEFYNCQFRFKSILNSI